MTVHIEHPQRDDQFEAWAEIIWRVEGLRFGVEELRHGVEEDPESFWGLAYLDDEPLGTGLARASSVAGEHYGAVRVLPEHRRRGVGSALLRAVAAHTRAAGSARIWGRMLAEDRDSLEFAEHRGFSIVGRERDVVLDLTKADVAAPEPPPGIALVSFAERPDLIRAVFAVDAELAADVPAHGAQAPMSEAEWMRENVTGPGAFLEACFVALDGNEVVGYTAIRRFGADSPEAENRLTAVRRPWRRRGIATALKRAQIERARAAGIEKIFTTNDETNVGMRGVNARLGYEPLPERIVVSGPA
ncbi:MAG TPA: GNAT family N-acetyltransferase [Gaiellaceae bacterium]|jgi:GNAT superfamily N-acetyltransferase|nr:GNAT family N-acetyltransferase [Gaiellaceae bacterium]